MGYLFRHLTDFRNNSHTAIAKSLGFSPVLEDEFAKIEVVKQNFVGGQSLVCQLDQKICPAWYNNSFQKSTSKYGKMLRKIRMTVLKELDKVSYCNLSGSKTGSISFRLGRRRKTSLPLKFFTSPKALSIELQARTGHIFPEDWCQKLLDTYHGALFGQISYANIESAYNVWFPKETK